MRQIALAALVVLLVSHTVTAAEMRLVQQAMPADRTGGGTGSLSVGQALKSLSAKHGLEIKGAPVSGPSVSPDLLDGPLDEVLKKLLRGYNYVVIRPGTSGNVKTILMVLGPVQRSKHVESPPAPPPATPAAGPTQPDTPQTPQQGQQAQPAGKRSAPAPSTPPAAPQAQESEPRAEPGDGPGTSPPSTPSDRDASRNGT